MDTTLHNATISDRLDLDYEDLRDEIYAALEALPEFDIISDTDMLRARELVAPLKALQGRTATAFKAEKQSYLDGGRAVDNFFKALRVSLDATVASLTAQASEYQARKLAEARAKAAEDARTAAFLDEPAPPAPAPAAMARVSDEGRAVISGAVRWDFEVVDINAVPRELLQPNVAAIRAKVAGLKATTDITKAAGAIPGLKIVEKISTTFR